MTAATPTWLLFLIFFLILAPALLAILLLRRSTRRVGDAPHCPGCDYLLHGLTSSTCPECGRALAESTIVRGDRHRSRPALVVGLFLLALSLTLAATLGLHTVRNFNWYTLRPTPWIIDDAASRDKNANPAKAWRELERRLDTSGRSSSNRQRLIALALDEQANSNNDSPPNPRSIIIRELLDHLGNEQIAGHLSPDQAKRFFENSARVRVRVRPTVVKGDPAPIEVSHIANSPAGGWSVRHDDSTVTVTVPGAKTIHSTGGGSVSGLGATASSTFQIPSLPPGEHTVTVTQRLRMHRSPRSSTRSTDDPLLHEWTTTTTASLKVLDTAPPDLIKRINDNNLAARMQSAISVKSLTFNPRQLDYANLSIAFTNPPAPVAFEVFVRTAGKESRAGTVSALKGATSETHMSVTWPKDVPRDTPSVDVVLRPSEKVARHTVDLSEYWGAEIVFPNVPVGPRTPAGPVNGVRQQDLDRIPK